MSRRLLQRLTTPLAPLVRPAGAHSALGRTALSSLSRKAPHRSAAASFATSNKRKEKVTVIGSGNWGSVAARIVGQNALSKPEQFDPEVKVWVFEEKIPVNDKELKRTFDSLDNDNDGKLTAAQVSKLGSSLSVPISDADAKVAANLIDFDEFGRWWRNSPYARTTRKLTELINKSNENIKYLPGVKLGSNVIAEPDLLKSVEGSSILVFVTPHQFIKGLCGQLSGKLRSDAKAISLIKGMDVTEHGFELISGLIKTKLNIDCSVLMGANIANEIALEQFSEATVGYAVKENGYLFKELFHTPYFHVRAVPDVCGAELCGTLKNIVALGAGFVDGLSMGNNTKAAVIRIGLQEMMLLAKQVFPSVKDDTFFESAGVADLITTCFGGRNRRCAEEFVRAKGKKTFDQLEAELLGGQKLQGVLTSHEVQEVLKRRGLEKTFPLFTTINRIVAGKISPDSIVRYAELP